VLQKKSSAEITTLANILGCVRRQKKEVAEENST
jgi:hypothetical protein